MRQTQKKLNFLCIAEGALHLALIDNLILGYCWEFLTAMCYLELRVTLGHMDNYDSALLQLLGKMELIQHLKSLLKYYSTK